MGETEEQSHLANAGLESIYGHIKPERSYPSPEFSLKTGLSQ
jgi:hypothetical protein